MQLAPKPVFAERTSTRVSSSTQPDIALSPSLPLYSSDEEDAAVNRRSDFSKAAATHHVSDSDGSCTTGSDETVRRRRFRVTGFGEARESEAPHEGSTEGPRPSRRGDEVQSFPPASESRARHGPFMPGEVRYEYRRKQVLREKMTPRRHFFAGVRRALLAAGVLALLIMALTSQDNTNNVQPAVLLEDDANLTPEEKLMEERTAAETETRLNERRRFLADKCAEEGLDRPGNDSLHRPNAWEFLVNREYHLIWCNIFKAASTSWMYNFNLLAGYSPQFLKASKAVPVSLARQKYPRHTADELVKFLNDSISFLIVRHPFERLLSAYRDKLEHSLPHTFHSNLGAHIVWHYRFRDPKTNGRHGPRYPLFEEFVRWLLCQWKAGNDLDMHWTPVVNFCTPCQVRFDVIAKFETLHEDQDYLIKQAHVGHIIKPEWKNPTRGVQTKDVIKNYFAQLSKRQIKELYEMFRYDFVLFDYSPEDYIALGSDADTKLICKK